MSLTIHHHTVAAPLPRGMFAPALFALLACAALAGSARVASAQSLNAGSPDLVISQVDTRGGAAGASYDKDFVEIFNRGTEPADMNNYGLHVTLDGNPIPASMFVRLASSRGIIIQPGRYLLIAFKGDGAGGQPLPTPDFDLGVVLPLPVPANLHPTSGAVLLVAPGGSGQGCPVGQTGVADVVGYAARCLPASRGCRPAPRPRRRSPSLCSASAAAAPTPTSTAPTSV